MKKLIYFLYLLTILSCREKSDVTPDVATLAKHQAPFGSETVDVKMYRILSDDQPISEFIFTNGFLSEHKKYLKFYGYPAQYAATILKRTGTAPVTGEKLLAPYSPEGKSVGEMKPISILTFEIPVSDSLREVSEKLISDGTTTSKKYIFNTKGFVIKEEIKQQNSTQAGSQTLYTRNSQNNIVTAVSYSTDFPAEKSTIVYEYDNNPNPFFYMGIDWFGERSIHSLSPNNVTKKTILLANGTSVITTYDFEYLPNGYPKRLQIKEVGTSVDATPNIRDFTYYE